MKIGFDVSQVGSGKAGCGYFADGMIRALTMTPGQNEYVLFTSFGDFFFNQNLSDSSPINAPGFHYGPRHQTHEQAAVFWHDAGVEQKLGGIDVIHSNNYWCPRQLQTARLVYTLYDLSFVQEPSWTTEANRVGCFYGVFGAATAADWIVAISQATRDHFLRVFPSFPAERVKVIWPGSRFRELATTSVRPGRFERLNSREFFLCVGTIEPRKNHERLLQAYLRYLRVGGRPIPLVLAGGTGWLMESFPARITELDLQNHVILTGYLADDELLWLYRNCYAHVYFSLFEGFGLPVLEGMELGAATIASDSTSIPEITGDAAILVKPTDVEALAQALLRLSQDRELRCSLSVKAREQARYFQWIKSAAQLVDLYQLACATPNGSARG